jgi:hypothetical protein
LQTKVYKSVKKQKKPSPKKAENVDKRNRLGEMKMLISALHRVEL